MAEKKSTSKTKSASTKTTASKSSGTVSLNKVSFWLMCAVAILYLVATILSACDVSSIAVGALQGIATAAIIVIVSILAWRYIARKQIVWKILYVICLLVVIVGIVLPLVLI